MHMHTHLHTHMHAHTNTHTHAHTRLGGLVYTCHNKDFRFNSNATNHFIELKRKAFAIRYNQSDQLWNPLPLSYRQLQQDQSGQTTLHTQNV